MRPQLLPVYLENADTPSFVAQLAELQRLTGDMADWFTPVPLGSPIPGGVDAVVVPDMTGRAYRMLEAFRAIEIPIVIVTSEFGTVSMWDWEIRSYLSRRGVPTIAPTSLQEYQDVIRSVGAKRTVARSTMLAYQDDLGAGMQPDIFKRFYWWEDECVADLQRQFGVAIQRRSFRELARRADSVSPSRVEATARRLAPNVPMVGLVAEAREHALRLYLALSDELDEAGDVIAAGINCLNESTTSPTTPCLAWNLLFEERGIIWGCEADLTSMITKVVVHRSLQAPVIMTNIYPFLMGQAALKHEKIPYFPDIPQPENHILVAHCGFLGVVPQSFSTEWTLRPRVLEIVDPRANAIDARLPLGEITIIKISSDMKALVVTPAELSNYKQYENSDCLNGAILRVQDGYGFVESTPSHHVIIAVGDLTRRLQQAAPIWGLELELGPALSSPTPLSPQR